MYGEGNSVMRLKVSASIVRLVLTAARLKVKVFQKVETRRQVKSNPLTLVEKVNCM